MLKAFFAGRWGQRDLVAAVGVLLIAQAVILAIRLVQGVVVARGLGPDGRGLVSLAVVLTSVGAGLAGAGLPVASAYFVSSRKLSAPDVLRNAAGWLFGLFAVTALIACLLLVAGSGVGLATTEHRVLTALAVAAITPTVAAQILASVVQGLRRNRALAGVRVAQSALALVAIVTAILMFDSAVSVVVGHVVAIVLLVGVTGLAVRPFAAGIRPAWDKASGRQMLGYGMRAQGGNVLQYFTYRLDVFLVGYFRGAAEVGLYAIAVALAELVLYLPEAVSTVLFPRVASDSASRAQASLTRVLVRTAPLLVVAAVVVGASSSWLIPFLYSKQFAGSRDALLLLLPGVVALGFAKIIANVVAALGRPGATSVIAGCAFATTVGLDLLLIPRFGIEGAAAASSIAYLVTLVGIAWVLRRMRLADRVSSS